MTPDVENILVHFLGRSRWFGGKGRPFGVPDVRRVGEVPGGGRDGAPRVVIDLAVVRYDDAPDDTELYQLPLAFYPETQDRLEHAFVGEWDVPELGPHHVYDALHDREAMALWLRCFDIAAERAVDPDSPLQFHRLPGHDLDLEMHSTLFSGEQSNSSVAFGEDALMKVFRKVTPGVNPDIEVHSVLTAVGSEHVAALYGWLDVVDEASDSVIQLAMLQQFLRTASDGWELALASVRNLFAEADLHAFEVGGDFAGEAARLGQALAETHRALAEHFPTERRSPPRWRSSPRPCADDSTRRSPRFRTSRSTPTGCGRSSTTSRRCPTSRSRPSTGTSTWARRCAP